MDSEQPQRPSCVERPSLVGREAERELLDMIVARARQGTSGALVLVGEPGIGKTALLEDALARAGDATTLTASGTESESELAFAGLSQLLRPLVGRIDDLPPVQAAALTGALGLGPAVPGDPLTTSVATLGVLAAAAERAGLVATVDDAHWLDPASMRALTFVARRLDADGVALLFAVRSDTPSALDGTGLPSHTLTRLDPDSARRLLELLEDDLSTEVQDLVLETAAGNPLALRELLLDGATVASSRQPLEPLRALSIEEHFLRQLDDLPAQSVSALVLASVADPDEPTAVIAALPAIGCERADLARAEAAGFVAFGSAIRFRHPLLRSAVYHQASPAERRAAHAALSEVASAASFPGRHAWHRALAADPPDEQAAQGLATVASAALLRGAPAEAAGAYELAARLTADPGLRSEWLVSAGESYAFAGRLQTAVEMLDDALRGGADPERRPSIRVIQARLLVGSGSALDAHALLTEEAVRLEADAPARAAVLHAEAGVAMLAAARPRDVLASAQAAYRHAEPLGGEPLGAATVALASALILVGDAKQGEKLLTALLETLEGADPTVVWQPLQGVAAFLAVLDRLEESRKILARGVAAARSLSAPGLLPYPLGTLAHVDCRLGRWPIASAEATEAIELSHQTGLVQFAAWALSARARIRAGQGHGQEARDDGLTAIESARMSGTEINTLYARAALIFAALSDGAPEEAIEHGEPLARLWEERGYRHPGVANWHADLLEAYVHTERHDRAEQLLESFAEQANETQGPWALAAVARCRGLLDESGDYEEHFAGALRAHEQVSMPFERARTELCLGERRRRAGRRVDAREPLRAALATFEDLGARPWADRARAELRACGETRARPDPGPLDELTPHELQVALVVARGATNREAAAELFLSPKTIDFHLRNIYRKLGLRSRSELARLLALEDPQSSKL